MELSHASKAATAQRRQHEEDEHLRRGAGSRAGGGAGRRSASFAGANAAQIRSNVGLVVVVVDGQFECSFAVAKTQRVRGRRRKRRGLQHLSFA